MTARTVPVSVIVPCFRCADTIGRAVQSILDQTWPVAEIILVEDCSGDDTLSALRDLQARLADSRVKIVPLSTNGGPGMARNAGWDAATQPWIAFLDADDGWHPRKIELQYGWLQNRKDVDLCAHDTALWGRSVDALASKQPVRIDPKALLFRNPIPTRSVILRRSLDVRFEGKRVTEDYLLWLELALSGRSLWKLPAVLAYSYRPEFSPGGYSGALWTHEKRELRCLGRLREKKLIGLPICIGASLFSLAKYVRRYYLMRIAARG